MTVRILGIDPGLSGGLALLTPATDDAPLTLAALPMPVVSLKGKGEIDLAALGAILGDWRPSVCWIEEQHSRPGQGVSSTFRNGLNYGILRTFVQTSNIPFHTVHPTTWKKSLAVPSDKTAARAIASRLFPSYSHLWARVKDDGIAEAALIALYGSRRP